ncbi:MAG: alpha/beta hydrolase [Alphaproteobacteria bacterium]|nr:alpha/beta hydrolase [Alphaproteobacteria bacterium]
MPYTTNDGHRLWYEVRGSGEPLTLIGGFALLHDQFELCLPHLHRLGYATIDWNYRGSGRSDWTLVRPYCLEDWVEDMRASLDAAGIAKTNIWATSTSSVIGTRFAAKYPERVKTLVTYPWYKADRYWQDLFDAVEGICRMFGPRALSRIFAGSVLPKALQYTPAQIEYEQWSGAKYEANLNLTTLKSTLAALLAIDLTGDVRNLKCPTVLLLGNDSALNAMESKKAASFDVLTSDFLRLKPDAKVAVVPGAGSTYCMITKPEETAKILHDALQATHR